MKQSEFFNDMFNDGSPSTDAENRSEGGSSKFPIIIPDETAAAFTLLLEWVYERGTTKWTQDDWVECLRMAHKFRVPLLTTAAMEFIIKSQIPPVKFIGLCVTYDLDWSWARDAIAELCNLFMPLPMSAEDGPGIPVRLCLEIFQVREILMKRRLEAGTSLPLYCKKCGTTKEVDMGCYYCKGDMFYFQDKMDMALVDKVLENMK
ncbi:hypothetical protein DL96DRAFT_503556 [Flagelloscypha sp. PMI_526]|nr:hypothetical protein DL96DRAFT_503556 [Flagelloscypha sp. PMI_526]